jgi:hypothetical protein
MKQGIYKITNDNYHNHFCDEPTLSSGAIKNILDSPARCYFDHPQLNPAYVKKENERKFDLGSAVHDYILEGGKKIEVIFGFDNWQKKAPRDLADLAYDAGKIPMLEKQYIEVQAIGESALKAIKDCSELGITDLQADGDAELSYIWYEDGVWLRTRPDFISHDKKLIIDLKTSTSADPNELSRKVVDMGYTIQSSLYKRGCNALNGITPEFIFVFVEIQSPYLCSIVSLSPEFQELGNQQIETAIKLWRHCLKTWNWPGYRTDRICWLEPKPWAISSWCEKKYDLDRMVGG